MSFTIDFDPENGCLICRIMGSLNERKLGEYAKAIVKAGQKHNCRRLINDMSEVRLDLSTVDIFNLPKTLDSMGIDSSWKRAIVFSGDPEKFRFLETRMVNEGKSVKIFQDHDAAVKWLKTELEYW